MREYTPDPRVYEMMTILSPDVSEDDLPAQIETIAGYITTAGGTVNETLRDSPWGRRRLAYSIRHTGRDIRDGFYTVFHFTLDPSGVRDIERDLKLNDQVMRFLITHFTPRPDVAVAAQEGVETAEAVAEAESSPVEDLTVNTVPAEAAAASETISEVVEIPSNEVTDVAEAADASEATETTVETEAAQATETAEAPATEAQVEDVEDVEAESAPVDEVVAAVESVDSEGAEVEEAPVAEAAPADEEATEETPAEPTAPAKDDEEA